MSKKKRPPVAVRSMKNRHIATVIVLSIVVFANSLPGNFVWDDEVQIVKNWRIRGFENLPSAFTSSFWSFLGTEAESQTNFYRPVQTVTYMLAYAIGGLSPAFYHVFNVAYHLAATIFVYLVCVELMFSSTIAFGIAALFAVHPVHTEAVSWIAGVPDVACGAFYFCSVWMFLRYVRTRRTIWVGGACASFLAALLAKEMAITLPFFLFLLLTLRERRTGSIKAAISMLAPLFAVAGLYLILRFLALGALARSHIDVQAGFLDWISLGVRVLGEYMRYALAPYPLNAFHLLPLKLEYRTFSTLLALISILLVGGLLWRLRGRAPDALVWFASFVVMLGPVFYFKGMSNMFFAERYLYIPSFAMLALMGSLCSRLNVGRLQLILGSVVMVFAVATIYRNETWRTSEKLYTATLQVQPEVVHMRLNLADIYVKRGEDAVAQSLLESSVQYLESDRYVRIPYELYRAQVGLGAIAARRGRYKEAQENFEKAIETNPRGDWGYLYLGGIFMEANNDYGKAIENFQKAIQLGPLNEVARDYMGIAMLNQKNYKEAIQYFEEALRINPSYEDARSHLAVASRASMP